jgi:predicted nuclease of restriction endonuclease-like (RecB) superfamily
MQNTSMPTKADESPLGLPGYGDLLAALKDRVRQTRFRAARAANAEVMRLYWSIGRDILERQTAAGWGSKVVSRLADDLKNEFPDQRGWSRTNLLYMRKAAEVWPDEAEFVHHAGGRLPWRHITVLLDRLDTRDDRDWYAARAADEGWSRAVLEHNIKADLRAVIGSAPSNFDAALDPRESDLARQLVKDPYVFEHLSMVTTRRERDVEQGSPGSSGFCHPVDEACRLLLALYEELEASATGVPRCPRADVVDVDRFEERERLEVPGRVS